MITSLTNQKIKHVIQLRERTKLRKEEGLFVAEGNKMFMEAPLLDLVEVYVSESFLHKNKGNERLAKVCYEIVADDVFKKMSDTVTPQGILCVIKSPECTLQKMLGKKNPLLLVLENIQDPGNLGTMIRTAEAAGADGIIMSSDTVDILNPKVIRSTMGSIYRVPFIYTNKLQESITQLKEQGISVYAAHLHGDRNYDAYQYTGGCAFVIGNEGNGLREETVALIENGCVLPMEGQVESLNASMAAGILLYEAYRQRRNNKGMS